MDTQYGLTLSVFDLGFSGTKTGDTVDCYNNTARAHTRSWGYKGHRKVYMADYTKAK